MKKERDVNNTPLTDENTIQDNENNGDNKNNNSMKDNNTVKKNFKITKWSNSYNNNKSKNNYDNYHKKELKTLILIRKRVSYTNAGGKKGRMAVVMAAFNPVTNMLGLGKGKSNQYFLAIQQAEASATKNMIKIKTFKDTIPHNVVLKHKTIKVLMFKNKHNVGLVAGSIARKIFNLVNIKNITCKYFGRSKSDYSVAYAIIKALSTLETAQEVHYRLNSARVRA